MEELELGKPVDVEGLRGIRGGACSTPVSQCTKICVRWSGYLVESKDDTRRVIKARATVMTKHRFPVTIL